MAASAKPSDPLLKMIEEIVAHAKNENLVIFYGWAHGAEHYTVHWNAEHGGGWQNFITCAKNLGTTVVYLNWAPFEEFQVDEALRLPEEESPDGIQQDASDRGLRQEIEKYRHKIGLTAVADLAFVHNAVTHIYQTFADWFESFETLKEEQEEKMKVSKGFLRQERPVDKALVRKWASELAVHPKFGLTRTFDQREYLLEKLADVEIDKLPVGEIVARADAIYQFEFKPKEEERICQEARSLRKQGLNINAIALKLGIPRDRVSGLLSGE